MGNPGLEGTAAAVTYIETHLREKLDLNRVAGGVGYSKYHLHRMFAAAAGMTLHDYIRRRQLTEAARLLVDSDRPILEIALGAGYESQQAFTTGFRAMYKRPPQEYRKNGRFYPLQLALVLRTAPPRSGGTWKVACAAPEDLPDWMDFTALVIGGFPGLETESHRERVRGYIAQKRALVLRDGSALVGAASFSPRTGSIDFLAAHPQYRRRGVDRALLEAMRGGPLAGRVVSITTFREGDRADTGQRAEYLELGFAASELLVEFGYPTQRLILPPERGAGL